MPTRYTKLEVRERLQHEIEDMNATKANPIAWEKVPEKRDFENKLTGLKSQLEAQTPPDTSPGEKDRIKARLAVLEEAIVKGNDQVPPMPSEYQMERVPAGTVDQLLQHESFWKGHTLDSNGNIIKIDQKKGERGATFEWKDLRRVLNKGREGDSPNVANLEILRPRHSDVALADLRLPRSYGLSPQARRNYDFAFPDHVPTDVEEKIEAPKGKRSGMSTASRKALSERMKAKWAAKRAQQEAAG